MDNEAIKAMIAQMTQESFQRAMHDLRVKIDRDVRSAMGLPVKAGKIGKRDAARLARAEKANAVREAVFAASMADSKDAQGNYRSYTGGVIIKRAYRKYGSECTIQDKYVLAAAKDYGII